MYIHKMLYHIRMMKIWNRIYFGKLLKFARLNTAKFFLLPNAC